MPIYVYICEECGRTEEFIKSIDTRDDPIDCVCPANTTMKRTLPAPGLVWAPTSGGYR
jgi:putative FmdB family regulatory protein